MGRQNFQVQFLIVTGLIKIDFTILDLQTKDIYCSETQNFTLTNLS